MPGDTRTRAARNRSIRQEELREKLAAQAHHHDVVDYVTKIADETQEIEPQMLQRYKIAIDAKLKLMSKYMPDLKAQEITGEGGRGAAFVIKGDK